MEDHSISSDPPFHEAYKILVDKTIQTNHHFHDDLDHEFVVEECELPVIDLGRMELEKEECKSDIARASREWGFFQVVNHGISSEILKKMRCEQEKLFKQPFDIKSKEDKLFNFSAGSYRWGTPTATCLRQFAWSEAFHIPLTDVLCFQ
ncbi:gibberellin 2-beta-dioxygenase 8 [Quillaja saponaria]|uniref:Gibberellin 2-beta-dioxygenase 8 n=1 Tax=Quillaja saponaria TaxID=32244 RepID=A0AAD7KWI3_QUISA|nr:gibberellin 2-beta-dioxygenase 8 [Quillaja saponaria]